MSVNKQVIYTPKAEDTMQLTKEQALGKTIGNFKITKILDNGKMQATCLLCGNENYSALLYKIKSGHSTSCGCKHKLVNPEQYIGEKYNMLKLLEVSPEKSSDGAVQGVFKCDCGNTVTRRLNEVRRGKLKSCGCLSNTYKKNITSETPVDKAEYKRIIDIWRQMLKRCYQSGDIKKTNPKILKYPELSFLDKDTTHPRYKDYGARGITVYRKWVLDRNEFYKWYKQNIRKGESMDRINNNGPYSPYNCRSLSNTQQNINQRVRKDNRTGYKGITWTGHSYRMKVKVDYKEYKKEGYPTKELALLERNILIVKNNFPHEVQAILGSDNRYHPVKSMLNPKTKMYHIAYIEYSTPIVMHTSLTTFKDKNDKVLVETIKRINQAVEEENRYLDEWSANKDNS